MGITSKIAVLLAGPVKNDSRVIKTCRTLAKVADVYLFYLGRKNDDTKIFDEKNIYLFPIEYPQGRKQYFLRHTFINREYDFFYKKVVSAGVKFNYVYANDFPVLRVAVKLKKNYNVKLIYDSHEIYAETVNQFFLKTSNVVKSVIYSLLIALMRQVCEHYEKKYLKQVDKFVTVNKSLANYFKEKYSLSYMPQVVMNFPYYYDTINAKKMNIRGKYNLLANDVLLLYQGNLNYGRGLELMLEVMRKLPEKYKLLIIGDGILRKFLERFVSDNNLACRVFFLGYLDNSELLDYTKEADIGFNLLENINKSKAMASPNKLFEYIQAEISSISTDTPENRNVVEKYGTGWLVGNDADKIAELILSISNSDVEQIKNNCKTAKKELCWERQEEFIVKLLDL